MDCLKIVKSRWIVLEKSLDNPAGTEISAVDAGRNIVFLCASTYFTEMLTECCLVPFSRQPSQLMCLDRIGALFSLAHSAAVLSLKA